MLTRRAFLGISAGLLAAPVATAGQHVKMLPRLGILSFHSASDPPTGIDAFVQGLRARGWIEGQNVSIERRYAEGRSDRLHALAVELGQSRVDVLIAFGNGSGRRRQARDDDDRGRDRGKRRPRREGARDQPCATGWKHHRSGIHVTPVVRKAPGAAQRDAATPRARRRSVGSLVQRARFQRASDGGETLRDPASVARGAEFG